MGLSRACALVRAAAAAAFAVPAARAASLGQGGQPFRPLDEALISHRALRYRHILGRSFRTLGPPLAAGWSAAWLGTPGAAAEKRWLRPPRKPSANQRRLGRALGEADPAGGAARVPHGPAHLCVFEALWVRLRRLTRPHRHLHRAQGDVLSAAMSWTCLRSFTRACLLARVLACLPA
eukprot:CAMPEP_0175471240 /NCGR_PEP_ID=MMETSP0095-20121207/73261_1 /TAXON_ID=311494 /ORGANISM="Alexandrium monilatum, Strain CCMP3105" /LENGTH=177 /DNA_ID=CAMNT_0016772693 /DNA_START=24 /DNA_END=555 /DNA_ORIENTATION=-